MLPAVRYGHAVFTYCAIYSVAALCHYCKDVICGNIVTDLVMALIKIFYQFICSDIIISCSTAVKSWEINLACGTGRKIETDNSDLLS
jgi:hypothetical protein